jgi:hypothetical protein
VHQMGIPCYEQKCPRCGAVMTREQKTGFYRDQ